MMYGFFDLIAKLLPVKVTEFGSSSELGTADVREPVSHWNEGNCITSRVKDSKGHALVIDLDIPAYLIPSSTPGHSHLYVDADIPEDKYFALLDSLADCGVIEGGYANVSKVRGYTTVRLPWEKKELPPVSTIEGLII